MENRSFQRVNVTGVKARLESETRKLEILPALGY
jgi:hypothetical protein